MIKIQAVSSKLKASFLCNLLVYKMKQKMFVISYKAVNLLFHFLQSDQVYKSVFIIFFQGDQLKTRVKKICEGFRATLYPCPEAPADRREMAMGVMTRIEDLNTVRQCL